MVGLLRPESVRNKTVLEGEVDSKNKKNPNDFVLWKSSKPGEPQYDSKWGPGRPGWHIECSVMASEIFGTKLDVHAGGVDLTFPHHENEIAQCQAYFGDSWVSYFFHTGHLKISGLKMSKSLKNFFTIEEVLEKFSSEVIRMLFLQHSWDTDMNYDEEQLNKAKVMMDKFTTFISTVESILNQRKFKNFKEDKNRSNGILNEIESLHVVDYERKILSENDKKAMNFIGKSKNNIDDFLSNNINTTSTIEELSTIVSMLNPNLYEHHNDVLRYSLGFIKRFLTLFGLMNESKNSDKEEDVEKNLAMILNSFRNEVRNGIKSKNSPVEMYKICDKLREDVGLLGYVIEDKGESVIRKVAKEQ